MTGFLYIVGDIIMLVALVGAIVFAVSYAIFFNWRITRAGRALMYFVLALIAWAAQSFAARVNPDYPMREWVRIVVYLGIVSTIWGLVVALWRSWGSSTFELKQRKDHR